MLKNKQRGFETLEGRQMMAGDVLAFMSSGALNIVEATASINQGQAVQVSQLANGKIRVSGLSSQDGGISKINGASFKDFTVTSGNVIVNLQKGNDTVLLGRTGANNFNSVTINTSGPSAVAGADRDAVYIENVKTKSHLTVDTGVGNDTVHVSGSRIGDNIGIDNLTIRTGAGVDSARVTNSTVYGNLTTVMYNASAENDVDYLTMQSAYARYNINAYLGGGNDIVDIYDGYAGNDVLLSTDRGNDTVKLREVRAVDDFWAYLGDDADTLDAQYLRADVLTLDGGAGYDRLSTSIDGPVTQRIYSGFEWVNGLSYYMYMANDATLTRAV